jgi:hypothetical protein
MKIVDPSFRLCGVLCLTAAMSFGATSLDSLKTGKATLKSAGVLAFGPDGILFVGDSMGASIVALDTQDRTANASPTAIEVKSINEKIAGLLGSTPDQIMINDLAVNPLSKNAYISVSRGRGPEAVPVILRVGSDGKISELPLDKIKFSAISLVDAPDDVKDQRGQSKRTEAITGLAFLNGKVIVSGLSNEEFSSNLRSIPFPFQAAGKGASIEIYHGSHGRFETNSPVRTFVAYNINNEPNILAAYTCTPLVRIPVSELTPGNKIKGKTIAELGNRNRPLDMVVYQKDGHNFILMSNSSRGVMKLATDHLDGYKAITAQTEVTGVPYETIADLKGVQQLDKYGDSHALILAGDGGKLDLHTIALP